MRKIHAVLSAPMKRRTITFVAALLATVWGCGDGGSPEDKLTAFFTDELVEAPARTVDIRTVTTPGGCDALLTVAHEEVASVGTVTSQRVVPYPVRPDAHPFEGARRGVPLAVDLAAMDANNLVVGRACTTVVLPQDEPIELEVELSALPRCSTPAFTLDVSILLDTSTAMSVADPSNAHLDQLAAMFLGPNSMPEGTRFSLVTHGHTPPQELIFPSVDPAPLRTALDGIKNAHEGHNRLYDGIMFAAALLRARAVCGRRPVLLVLQSDIDGGSEALFEDATIAVVGARGDDTDDLITAAVAFNRDAYNELNDLIPVEVGDVFAATTEGLRAEALSQARQSFIMQIQ